VPIPPHSVLGNIDASAPGYWQGKLRFAERDVEVDLSIERGPVPEEVVTALLARLEKLAELDGAAREAMLSDGNAGVEEAPTLLYLEHHRDELSDEELQQVFGSADRDLVDVNALLRHLHLVRVGLRPEDAEYQLLLDYSLGYDVTNYLICAVFDSDGKFRTLDMES